MSVVWWIDYLLDEKSRCRAVDKTGKVDMKEVAGMVPIEDFCIAWPRLWVGSIFFFQVQ